MWGSVSNRAHGEVRGQLWGWLSPSTLLWALGAENLDFQVFMANTLTGGAALETHGTQFSILSWWEKGSGCVPVTSMKWRDGSTTEIPFDL